MFSSCSNDDKDNGSNNNGGTPSTGVYKVKTANITYDLVENGILTRTETVMWDDYGKLYRIGDAETASIVDEKAGKGWSLDHREKTYIEYSATFYEMALAGRNAFKYKDNPNMPGYQKLPNRTIAGKECTVYSTAVEGITKVHGSWNEIPFLKEETGVLVVGEHSITLNETYTATSYSETVPANSFKVPSDYTLRPQ